MHLLQVRENVRVVTSEVNVVELNIDGVLDPFHAPSAMCNRWRSLLAFGERRTWSSGREHWKIPACMLSTDWLA